MLYENDNYNLNIVWVNRYEKDYDLLICKKNGAIKHMVKKDFTVQYPKECDNKSDVELIEKLNNPQLDDAARDVIKSILDMRTKKSIQYLTEIIQKNSKITEKHNKRLIGLTWSIVGLTIFMLVAVIIQIILIFNV